MQTCRRLILAVAVIFSGLSQTDAALSAPQSVNEEMFVRIGGIDQWVTIRGDDRDNPILLVLHGGPGNALTPFADSLFTGWEKDFTLVQWDQRGAGRTYGKTGPSVEATMTVERMAQDGIELAEYLTRHLGKRRAILTGGSWGSILGIHMVRSRSDLFYAYVGQAQVVNWQKGLSASYAAVLRMAEAATDQETVAALQSIGSPPWKTLFPQWRIYRKAQQAYQSKIVTAPNAAVQISAAYSGPAERKQYSEAEDFSMFHFWSGRQPTTKEDATELPLSGPLTAVDLTTLGINFKIPIYIVQGQVDLMAPPELAKVYFDSLDAPNKEFFLVPGAGHEPNAATMDITHKVLLEQVKPLTR